MLDKFGREINYLRIAVTDRCNLACYYCRPRNDAQRCRKEKSLAREKIISVVKAAIRLGIDKVRLTGGEPFLRSDIVQLVQEIAQIGKIKDLTMTTNGIFLAEYAKPLVAAGLMRVNISLDTTDAQRFASITRGGKVEDVFAGIAAARRAKLMPIKINCVVKRSTEERDARLVKKFARQNNFEVRFIRLMSFRKGNFTVVEGGRGGDCKNCNRIRLLADGRVLPCLFSDATFSIDELGIDEALKQAILNKPKKGLACSHKWMRDIGG